MIFFLICWPILNACRIVSGPRSEEFAAAGNDDQHMHPVFSSRRGLRRTKRLLRPIGSIGPIGSIRQVQRGQPNNGSGNFLPGHDIHDGNNAGDAAFSRLANALFVFIFGPRPDDFQAIITARAQAGRFQSRCASASAASLWFMVYRCRLGAPPCSRRWQRAATTSSPKARMEARSSP